MKSIKIIQEASNDKSNQHINKTTDHTESKDKTFLQMLLSRDMSPVMKKACLILLINLILRSDLQFIIHQN